MQYLPTIIKDVVARVNAAMIIRLVDPFAVFFEYGLFQDVAKTVYTKKDNGVNTYPLVWLQMPFDELKGRRLAMESEVTCTLILAVPTEPNLTMAQREANSFNPRLFPVYERFISELSKEKRIQFSGQHTKRILPYWGGDETGNANAANFSKDNIDAVQIKDLKIQVKRKLVC